MTLNIFKYLSDNDKSIFSKKEILWRGIIFYFISFIIVAIILVAFKTLLSYYGIEINRRSDDIRGLTQTNLLAVFIASCIVAPLNEEIMFRLWLSFKRYQVAISVFAFSFFILPSFGSQKVHNIFSGTPFYQDILTGLWYKLPISFIMALIFYFIPQEKYYQVKNNNKRWRCVLFLSTICFALMHILNYKIDISLLPIYVILCLPQFVCGVTLCYYRVNVGFWYAVLFHSLSNGSLLFLRII